MKKMSKILGIDLGTSTSEAAVLKDGKPFVIPNQLGAGITPSFIGISEEGSIIVGQEAKDQFLARPHDTVMEVKRHMGKNTSVLLSGRAYTPQALSSEILKYLKKCAEVYCKEDFDRAVITVPAYFTDEQRKATVEAGKLAGFKVERIINEPTAAALAYGLEHLNEEAHVLVYDLGGGTLDVTLLEMFDGVLEVKASSGNNELGGKDFDERLITYLKEQFHKQQGIDLAQDIYALSRLKKAAEECKKALTFEESAKINLPFIASKGDSPLALETEITRDRFEELILDLVESSKKPIDIVLKDSGMDHKAIDVILLVGGSTRIPLVKRFIAQELGQEPKTLVDPDMAVVMGAAIQGGILEGAFNSETDLLITDVCPYTLGIRVLDFIEGMPIEDAYSILIPRNTTIPVTKSHIYATSGDNQTEVEISIYQGDHKRASSNNLLGEFRLKDIPPNRVGKEKIKVEFSYDVNGILKVEAYIVSTGQKAGIEITTTGVQMTEEVDLNRWHTMPLAKRFKRTLKKAEKRLLEVKEDEEFIELTLELEELIDELKRVIILEDEALSEETEEDLLELLYSLEDIE